MPQNGIREKTAINGAKHTDRAITNTKERDTQRVIDKWKGKTERKTVRKN